MRLRKIALAAALVLACIGIFYAGRSFYQLNNQVSQSSSTTPPAVSEQAAGDRLVRWMIIVLAISSLTTLAAVAISFYLYRWRKILLASPHAILPEEHAGYLRDLGHRVASLEHGITDRLHQLDERTQQSSEKVEDMTETFMALHDAVDARDREIKRLKIGYDAEIFRRFLMRFIRVDRSIQDFLDDKSLETESLTLVKRLLEDALDDCGVEPFDPEVGEDYRSMRDEIADNPKEIPTADRDQDFQVSEIVERGYRLRGADNRQIIAPAKVRIFRHKS